MARPTTQELIDAAIQANNATLLGSIREMLAPATQTDSATQTDTTTQSAPATQTAPATQSTRRAARVRPVLATSEIVGTISYIARKGMAAQLDGTPNAIDRSIAFYNCRVVDGPLFAPFAVGTRVMVTTTTYDQGEHEGRTMATAVEKIGQSARQHVVRDGVAGTIPSAEKLAKAGIATQTDQTVGLAVARRSGPTATNPDGCPFCKGARHGKLGKAGIASECAIAQYIIANPDQKYLISDTDTMRAYLDWRDGVTITVAIEYDGSKSAVLAGKNVAAKTATVHTTRNGAVTSTATTTQTVTATGEAVSGNIVRINAARNKFQLTGHKVRWFTMAAGTLSGRVKVGTAVTGTVTAAGFVPAPKA